MDNNKIVREIMSFTEKLTKFEQQKSTGTPPIVLIDINSAAFNLAVVVGEEVGYTYDQINEQYEQFQANVTSKYDMTAPLHYIFIMKHLFNAFDIQEPSQHLDRVNIEFDPEEVIETALVTNALLVNRLNTNE